MPTTRDVFEPFSPSAILSKLFLMFIYSIIRNKGIDNVWNLGIGGVKKPAVWSIDDPVIRKTLARQINDSLLL